MIGNEMCLPVKCSHVTAQLFINKFLIGVKYLYKINMPESSRSVWIVLVLLLQATYLRQVSEKQIMHSTEAYLRAIDTVVK